MATYELLGFAAILLSLWGFFPTVINIVREQSYAKLDGYRVLLQAIAFLLWFIYGIRISAPALVIAAGLTFVCCLILLGLKMGVKK